MIVRRCHLGGRPVRLRCGNSSLNKIHSIAVVSLHSAVHHDHTVGGWFWSKPLVSPSVIRNQRRESCGRAKLTHFFWGLFWVSLLGMRNSARRTFARRTFARR